MKQFRHQLDIYNPGEFYAALGLLTVFSLQHRPADLDSHFELLGHQGDNNSELLISSERELRAEDVSDELKTAQVTADTTANIWRNPREKASLSCPVVLSTKRWSIVLDWWLDELRYAPASNLKLWSGNSNPADMLRTFIRLGGGSVHAGGTVFGFDTRISRDALAVGFSKKDTRQKAALYPRTELLCAIGLQQYRPRNCAYYAWHSQIPLSVTHAAAMMEIPGLPQTRIEFEIRKIGQGAKEVVSSRHRS